MNETYQTSYYFSYKDWANQPGLQMWPFYVCIIIAFLLGYFIKEENIRFALAIFTLLVGLFCVFVTSFYANSVLEVDENGLTIKKRKRIIQYSWQNISNVIFITPSARAPYREIVLVIYYQDKDNIEIDYVFIESLYFKWANKRSVQIGISIEKHLTGYNFKIHRSNFHTPLFLKRTDLQPTIYS